jgi:hypothetical protein
VIDIPDPERSEKLADPHTDVLILILNVRALEHDRAPPRLIIAVNRTSVNDDQCSLGLNAK